MRQGRKKNDRTSGHHRMGFAFIMASTIAVAGCNEERVTNGPKPAPQSPPVPAPLAVKEPDPEAEILATLRASAREDLRLRCFDADLGAWRPTCDLAGIPSVVGFSKAVDGGIKKVNRYLFAIPGAASKVALGLDINVMGQADGAGFKGWTPRVQTMIGRYYELARKHEQTILDATFENLNTILACLRALELLEAFGAELKTPLAQLRDAGSHIRYDASVVCKTVPNIGPAFRGAELEAHLSIVVPPPLIVPVSENLKESGWDVRAVRRRPGSTRRREP